MVRIYTYRRKKRLSKSQGMFFLSMLSSEELNRAYGLKFRRDFEEFITSRYFLRKILAAKFGLDPKGIKISTSKSGRPFLSVKKAKGFDFNVSHSGDWIIVALNRGKVGVDIERIDATNLDISRECFCDEEIEYLHERPGAELTRFYKLWTLKESFVKAIGDGLTYPLKKFYFRFCGSRIKMISSNLTDRWHFKSVKIADGYSLSICSNEPMKKLVVENINSL